MSFSPQNTRALVVGIERYGFGSSWDLPGPVADAHRFIAWLQGRGVPAANITAFLTEPVRLLPPDLPPLPAGVRRHAATSTEIERALEPGLLEAPPEVLWLWWGGHGVVQQDVGRALFFEDSSNTNRHALNLEKLQSFFRFAAPDHPGALRRVLAVIDACSTHGHVLGLPGQLPHKDFGSGNPVPGRDCALVCASQTGQSAKNFAIEQTGLLSREILPRLAASPSGVWPPDLGDVARDLRKRFLEINRDGKGGQLPAYYSYETPDGHEPPLRFNRPLKLSVTEKGKLRDALLQCPSMKHPGKRQAVVDELPEEVRNNIERDATANFDVFALVNACLEQSGGFTGLVETLRVLDASPAVVEFTALAARLGVWSDPSP